MQSDDEGSFVENDSDDDEDYDEGDDDIFVGNGFGGHGA